MATTPLVVFPEAELYRAVVYTGSNSADINALIDDFTINGETATHLTFTSAGLQQVVSHGSFLVYQNGAVTDVYLNEDDFREAFGDVASAVDHYHEITLKTGTGILSA